MLPNLKIKQKITSLALFVFVVLVPQYSHASVGPDLEIVELVTPSLTSTESSASIQIVIRNNGDVDANFTDYAICITGDAPQSCETTVTNIEAGSTDTLTLLSTLDLSSKPYNVIFYTSMLAPDANPANDTLKVMFDIALATNSLNNVSAVNVYPNPSNGIIYVDLEGLNSASVIVRAITGELVFQETDINSPLYEINMNGEVGLYLIEVSSEGHQAITKVLLK